MEVIVNNLAAVHPKPWDLALVIGGQRYRVRPLTCADVQRWERIGKGQETDVSGFCAWFRSLLTPEPEVSSWTLPTLRAVFDAIRQYMEEPQRPAAIPTAKLMN